MGLNNLTLMHQPSVAYISSKALGLFNHLAWPNIAFLILGIVIFAIGAYARMPHFMEMDKQTRKRYEKQQKSQNDEHGGTTNEH